MKKALLAALVAAPLLGAPFLLAPVAHADITGPTSCPSGETMYHVTTGGASANVCSNIVLPIPPYTQGPATPTDCAQLKQTIENDRAMNDPPQPDYDDAISQYSRDCSKQPVQPPNPDYTPCYPTQECPKN